jgi:leucyl aminopeptidase (aminopeptidase T)
MNAFLVALWALAWGVLPPCGQMGPPAPPPPSPPLVQTAQQHVQEMERAEARARQAAERVAAEAIRARQQRPDNVTLAERLADLAQVAPADLVLVRGAPGDSGLLQAIAAQVRRRGGSPLVVMAGDELARGLIDDAPRDMDARPNGLDLVLAASVTVVIDIEADNDPTALAHIPGERLAARARAEAVAEDLMRHRAVRRVELGHGLYPTPTLARHYAMNEEEFSRVFWLAATADPARLRAAGEDMVSSLAGGSQAVITNPNGTNIKFRLAGAAPLIADGTPPAAGSPLGASLPAGEFFALAAPGSGEGRIVADRVLYQGREITGLSVTFRAGKVTGISARSGVEYLRKLYDAAGPGKDQIGALIIGLNGDLRAPSGVKVDSTLPLGVVSLSFGGTAWAGGENSEPFSFEVPMPGSTLTIDGRVVVAEGALTPNSGLPPDESTGSTGGDAAARPRK